MMSAVMKLVQGTPNGTRIGRISVTRARPPP